MAEWIKFDGSEEQLRDINNAEHGWLAKFKKGGVEEIKGTPVGLFIFDKIDSFLICEPNPHVNMIIEWARTGRPVYAKHPHKNEWQIDHNPGWFACSEYSFDPPKEKFMYRTALLVTSSNSHYLDYAREESEISKIQGRPGFVRWLTDWQEVEV